MHAGTYVQAHSHYSVFVRVCAFSVCVCAFACESVSVCVCACAGVHVSLCALVCWLQ
jgi:hypothetical protein